MSKHTLGPWQVNGSHVYTADPERALLAQVFNPGSKASDYPLVENARLIADAPRLYEENQRLRNVNAELLAALKSLIDTRHKHFINNEIDGMHGWDEKALAAIAKAEGKP